MIKKTQNIFCLFFYCRFWVFLVFFGFWNTGVGIGFGFHKYRDIGYFFRLSHSTNVVSLFIEAFNDGVTQTEQSFVIIVVEFSSQIKNNKIN